MTGAIGFVVGVLVTGLVWYVKDYCMDSLYLKGYKRGYDKGYGYREMLERAGDALCEGMRAGLQKESEE